MRPGVIFALAASLATAIPARAAAQHTPPTPRPSAHTEPRHDRASAPATPRTPRPEATRDRVLAMPTLAIHGTPPPPMPCLRAPVEIRRVNGHATWTGSLTDCDGHPTLHALAAISVLASPTHLDTLPDLEPVVRELRRVAPAVGWALVDEHPHRRARTPCPPGTEPLQAPTPALADEASTSSPRSARTRHRPQPERATCRAIDVLRDARTTDPLIILEGHVRIVNPRLLAMLDLVTQHFVGHRVEVISGFRPSPNAQAGSRHAHARALDYRLEGVPREALRDFAYTLPLAGVGYYPNSVFVHMDVRDAHEGSARWTDYSSQGETPRYGHWPPRDQDVSRETDFLVNQAGHALDALRADETARGDDSDETGAADAPAPVHHDSPAQPGAHEPALAERTPPPSAPDVSDEASSHAP